MGIEVLCTDREAGCQGRSSHGREVCEPDLYLVVLLCRSCMKQSCDKLQSRWVGQGQPGKDPCASFGSRWVSTDRESVISNDRSVWVVGLVAWSGYVSWWLARAGVV